MDPSTSSRKSSGDPGSSRSRLAQFAETEGRTAFSSQTYDGTQNLQNWPQMLVSCGSNAFNQLSASYGELMTPTLTHIPHQMFTDMEILQVSCGGNQTAVLMCNQAPHQAEQRAEKEDGSTVKKPLTYQLYTWGVGRTSSQMRVPVTLPAKITIAQLSCGHTHMGFVTERGQAFTWGAGDYGMLGHGTKSAVAEPRRVETFKTMVCTAVSCGAYHTAFIAAEKDDVTYVRFPRREHVGSHLGVGLAGARLLTSEECAAGGSLYMCGLGKAGQLGLADRIPLSGSNAGCVPRPTLVPFFEEESARVIRVSCGFHHTLAIAVPKQALRVFSPTVYAFGFGEYGRLGNGDEEQMLVPTPVQFPAPFHATQVSAGEQHSVALGNEGCYAWGSNDMGQLGTGSSPPVEMATLPQKVQLPEGMAARRIAAGGRHTAVVTHCGTVLSWGWGEEGQLGHGTEKSSSLPRPCRLPKVCDRVGVPMDLALGGTHTVVVLHNPGYIAPAPQVDESAPTPEPEPLPTMERCPTPPPPQPEPEPEPIIEQLQASIEIPEVAVMPPVEHKPPTLAGDEDEDCGGFVEPVEEAAAPPPPVAIRGLKDILQQREERKAAAAARESEREAPRQPTPEPPPPAVEEEPQPPPPEPEVLESEPQEPPQEGPLGGAGADTATASAKEQERERVEGSALFNNIAARAEARKARKASVTGFGSSTRKL